MVEFSPYTPSNGLKPYRGALPPAFAMDTPHVAPYPLMMNQNDYFWTQTMQTAPPLNPFINQPGFHPVLNALSLWLQQNGLVKKPVNSTPITPRKGAEVGAISLGAMGLLFKGFSGLLWGGAIGAVAGSSIISVIKRQNR